VVVTGNDDGAHHVTSEVLGALGDIGSRSASRRAEPTSVSSREEAMTESPREQHGPPPEEHIDPADAADRLAQDPEAVPNAPNRPPAESPIPADSPHEVGAGRHRGRDVEPPGERDEPMPSDPPH
jgi:hypothetical protein